jgi:hypothetical protein
MLSAGLHFLCPTTASSLLRLATYRLVISSLLCPSRDCTSNSPAPFIKALVAKVCLKVCAEHLTPLIPDLFPRASITWAIPQWDRGFLLVNNKRIGNGSDNLILDGSQGLYAHERGYYRAD